MTRRLIQRTVAITLVLLLSAACSEDHESLRAASSEPLATTPDVPVPAAASCYARIVSVTAAAGALPEEVGRMLLANWLDGGMSTDCGDLQLAEYRIESTQQWRPGRADLVLGSYSVRPRKKPTNANAIWLAGNGKLNDNRWVTEKTVFLGIRDDGNGNHTLIAMNTSPPP